MFDLIDQSTGQSWLRWTIRLAVACILLRIAVRWARSDQQSRIPSTTECWLWSAGFVLYGFHVILAFHFVHGWSHVHAWQHTADETARLTGIKRGEGVWANYAFTLIWATDVVRLIIARMRDRPTLSWLDAASVGFFGFMCFNATVVFGPPLYRWLAVPTVLALYFAWRHGRLSKFRENSQDSPPSTQSV